MEKTEKKEEKTSSAIVEREKIRNILIDHMEKIKSCIWVDNDYDANMRKIVIFVRPYDFFQILPVSKTSYDRPIDNAFEIILGSRNIYNYIDNLGNTDAENIRSFMVSDELEEDIMREIDEQLEEVQ
jgi:hypothetical protein